MKERNNSKLLLNNIIHLTFFMQINEFPIIVFKIKINDLFQEIKYNSHNCINFLEQRNILDNLDNAS